MTASNSANGAMLSSAPAEIEVGTGAIVDLLNPDPATLEVDDIARGLAYTCRYGGHVKRFYSVAEHSVLVHDLMRHRGADELALDGALFHDAAEAYLGDVVAPLKWAMREVVDVRRREPDRFSAYDELERRMELAIIAEFGLRAADLESRELRVADMWALRIEARELTTSGGDRWRWPGELPNGGQLPDGVEFHGGIDPDAARRLWLRRLTGGR